MERTAPRSSFRLTIEEEIEDAVSGELMTRAVTVVPCGHIFNEDTVTQCLARNRLCPLDRKPIDRYVPNYTIRRLAETAGSPPQEEKSYTSQSEAYFLKGKKAAEEGNLEGAIECLLEALRISPYYEKAQGYLEFCLQKTPSKTSNYQDRSENRTLYNKEEYIDHVLLLLEEPAILADSSLSQILEREVEELMEQESSELSEKSIEKYKWTKKLLIDKKISQFVAKKLKQFFSPNHRDLKIASLSLPFSGFSTMSLSRSISPSILELAFGKAKWEKYFGSIGHEPPLLSNIEEILDSPCPFWQGKKVHETHLLILIPKTLNNQYFNLNLLTEIIQKSKSNYTTKCDIYSPIRNEHGRTYSKNPYWILVSKDVVPGSRNKSYLCQERMLLNKGKNGTSYTPPTVLEITTSILMHFAETGEKLYSDNSRPYSDDPGTWTRCRERINKSAVSVAVGGFDDRQLYIDFLNANRENNGICASMPLL